MVAAVSCCRACGLSRTVQSKFKLLSQGSLMFTGKLCIFFPWKVIIQCFFFFSSRRRHTRLVSDWSSDVCSSDLRFGVAQADPEARVPGLPGEPGAVVAHLELDAVAHAARGDRHPTGRAAPRDPVADQIGRASCRERV